MATATIAFNFTPAAAVSENGGKTIRLTPPSVIDFTVGGTAYASLSQAQVEQAKLMFEKSIAALLRDAKFSTAALAAGVRDTDVTAASPITIVYTYTADGGPTSNTRLSVTSFTVAGTAYGSLTDAQVQQAKVLAELGIAALNRDGKLTTSADVPAGVLDTSLTS